MLRQVWQCSEVSPDLQPHPLLCGTEGDWAETPGESALFPHHLPPFPIQKTRVRDQSLKTLNPKLLMLEKPDIFEAKHWSPVWGVIYCYIN